MGKKRMALAVVFAVLVTTMLAFGTSCGGSQQEDTPEVVSDPIYVTVSIESANAAAYDSKWPESFGYFENVQVESGATAYDALVACGVTVSQKKGSYVDSIGGLAEKACGANSGWMYSVNGTFPNVSAMKYELSDGDFVRWAYTVKTGDVEEDAPAS